MKNKLLYINLILVFSIIYLSCDNSLGPEFYDDGSFYYYFDQKIKIYPSNSIMSVKFKNDLSPLEAKKILEDYKLEFYSEFYHDGVNLDTLIVNHEIIAVKINSVQKKAKNFITRYPKVNFSGSCFGNLPEVKYCLPSYSRDGTDKHNNRFFITEGIVFKITGDSASLNNILQEYSLELIPQLYLEKDRYESQLTEYSKKDPLNLANELQEDSKILWATADFVIKYNP